MADSREGRRKRAGGETRVRSGCWRCRERRVKCPEQRPVCSHCRRLGLNCGYGFRLTWQKPSCPKPRRRGAVRELRSGTRVHVHAWMFLGVAVRDFETPASNDRDLVSLESTTARSYSLYEGPGLSAVPAGILPINISSKEARLWDYFANFIAPKCTVSTGLNPYHDVVLRIAAGSPSGPLFRVIMAVAASQRYNLGQGEEEATISELRGLALRSLITYLAESRRTPEETIIATVMMGFLEILQSCSLAWIVHANYGQRLLVSYTSLKFASPDIYHFATTWLTGHNVLAGTVWWSKSVLPDCSALLDSTDEHYVHALTGCSKSLLRLISAITNLANLKSSAFRGQAKAVSPGENSSVAPRTETYEQQRHILERQLHQYSFHENGTSEGTDDEERHISGIKHLAALMYFYARVDESGPYETHMGRLTEEILRLIPRISLRTNTLLWPLVIVGTLGVRPDADDNRLLVLRTLDALQQTRQLGCVRKARFVMEDVWKARDLSPVDAARGWSILDGRHSHISLA